MKVIKGVNTLNLMITVLNLCCLGSIIPSHCNMLLLEAGMFVPCIGQVMHCIMCGVGAFCGPGAILYSMCMVVLCPLLIPVMCVYGILFTLEFYVIPGIKMCVMPV